MASGVGRREINIVHDESRLENQQRSKATKVSLSEVGWLRYSVTTRWVTLSRHQSGGG